MTTALMLPGQGSQYVGMGRDLAEAHPIVRELFEEADELLGFELSRICWEGPRDRLTATQNAQPAILLHSYAVWRLLEDRLGDDVIVAAGHSLGEFSAHLLAGTFEFAAALRLVRRRGELMAGSGSDRPGTMVAVLGLEADEVKALTDSIEPGVVVTANINAPGQVVISGDVGAVEAASVAAAERGARKVLPLEVSGAFHTRLMNVASDGLAAALDDAAPRDPGFPVISNATVEAVTDGDGARTTLMAQLTSPVRWVECVEAMGGMGPARFIEIGPGRVLAGLLRRIDRSLSGRSIGDLESVEDFGG